MLDAALYPDFGQVEVDPAVVNLTAFETFFPERRPFFSRDDRMFQFGLAGGQNQLIHSRRIGRRPSGRAPAGADFVSMPSETTVIAATKVTGRTAWGLSVGLLGAVTDHEHGWAYFEDEEEAVRFDAEPRTHYGVVSLSQDLRQGQTRIGGILSMVDRSLPANGSLRDDRLALGNFDLSRDGRALLSGSGENVFMIKVDRLFYF